MDLQIIRFRYLGKPYKCCIGPGMFTIIATQDVVLGEGLDPTAIKSLPPDHPLNELVALWANSHFRNSLTLNEFIAKIEPTTQHET
jgi:hypothetical protein